MGRPVEKELSGVQITLSYRVVMPEELFLLFTEKRFVLILLGRDKAESFKLLKGIILTTSELD